MSRAKSERASDDASGLARIRDEIIADPDNAWAAASGYEPLYVAAPPARIVIIGQAPGRKAQESGIAWNDTSGRRLLEWLGVPEIRFRDSSAFAVLPMDFYYPGKGAHGDDAPWSDQDLSDAKAGVIFLPGHR